VALICPTAQGEYFSGKGWTGFANQPTGKSASLALTETSRMPRLAITNCRYFI